MALKIPEGNKLKSGLEAYGIGIGAFALLILIVLVLRALSIKLDITLLCIAALLLSAWYGGTGPGILVAVLLEVVTIALANPRPGPRSAIILAEVNRTALLVLLVVLVSSRKKAEQKLSKLAAIVETSDDAIIGKSPEGVITSWNEGARKMYGYEASEVIGRSLSILLPPGRFDELPQILSRLKQGEHISHYETTRLTKDGNEISVSLAISPITGPSGDLVGASTIARDISERKSLEAQLRQAQKMEALGRLAGGVAHDFNNLLTVILGYCDFAIASPEAMHGPLIEYLTQIRAAGSRAATLTKQLLVLSRRQVLQPTVIDLNDLVLDVEKMLRRLIGEDIRLASNLDPNLGRIHADPGQIEQVVMNLAINARDAMPEGGNLTIDTANVYLDELYSAKHPEVQPGHYVLLAVSDTGTGMDDQTRARVFEPFFTTKERGKGTGLGLSIVFGIVKQSGGHIWVYSEPGAGTTFKVYLPLTEQPFEPAQTPLRAAQTLRGSETVLVVEDEEGVRAMVTRILRMNGYSVLEAPDGAKAIQDYSRDPRQIDLAITDMVMPNSSGRELARRLTLTHPAMRILFMSGYTDTAVTQRGILEPGAAFIQKPFTAQDLLRKVREVLDTGNSAPLTPGPDPTGVSSS